MSDQEQAPPPGEIVVGFPGPESVASAPAGFPGPDDRVRPLPVVQGSPPPGFPVDRVGLCRDPIRSVLKPMRGPDTPTQRVPAPRGPSIAIPDGEPAAAAAAAVGSVLKMDQHVRERLAQLDRDIPAAVRDARQDPNHPTQAIVALVRRLGRFVGERQVLERRAYDSPTLDEAAAARAVATEVCSLLATLPRFAPELQAERERRIGSINRDLTENERMLQAGLDSPPFLHDQLAAERFLQGRTEDLLAKKRALTERLAAIELDGPEPVVLDIIRYQTKPHGGLS